MKIKFARPYPKYYVSINTVEKIELEYQYSRKQWSLNVSTPANDYIFYTRNTYKADCLSALDFFIEENGIHLK